MSLKKLHYEYEPEDRRSKKFVPLLGVGKKVHTLCEFLRLSVILYVSVGEGYLQLCMNYQL